MIQNLGFPSFTERNGYNNYNDIFSALSTLDSFKGKAATVVIKHANPCGVSENKYPIKSFKNAYACDPVSAFGSVIACNYKIDKKVALEICKTFLKLFLLKVLIKIL